VNEDRGYLLHILECIRRIEESTKDGRAAFDGSHTVQDAVIRNLQVLCESSKRISEGLKATEPDTNWRGIAAFRNVVVHDYFGIELGKVWEIVRDQIPALKTAVLRMVGRL
jgi:uncharacterized protein with HEPN domain